MGVNGTPTLVGDRWRPGNTTGAIDYHAGIQVILYVTLSNTGAEKGRK